MITFTVSDKEQKTAIAWMKRHRKRCSMKKVGHYIGFSYRFVPTGIGDAIIVRCACGKAKNVTNYKTW